MIPDETIELVRETADIVEVIGEHVPLKRQGQDWRGPCPFHQGKHRNFSVSPRKRMYYCFVCHAGGDVFDFLQKRLGVDWPTAVRIVAEKSGIEVREVERKREGPDPRAPFWEANAAAAEFFQRVLWDDSNGAPAREYLAARRITRDVAEKYGLGFAPRDTGLLRSHLTALGFDDERQRDAGLLTIPDEGEPRTRFRNRLMFPIFDPAARAVGFGGRVIGVGEPKYLNSPESAVFSKGKLLYGLNWAKLAIRRDDRVLVVEGYFDALRLMAAGIESVVAPLGTALTADQAALVRRYTTSAFLLYDSDKAGLRATFRSGDELLRHGMSVQVVTLPEGEDPDTFVDAHGKGALEAQLAEAIDVFERKVQLLERAGWFGDLRRKRKAIDRLLPTIRATADPLMRDLYIARAAEAAGVGKELLEREAAEALPGPRAPAPYEDRADGRGPLIAPPRRGDRRGAPRAAGAAAERALVHVMLHYRSEVDALAERIGPEQFRDPCYREIFSTLLEEGSDITSDALLAAVGDEAAAEVEALLAESGALLHVRQTVDGALASLRRREVDARLAEIDGELPLATGAQKDDLIREKVELVNELRQLGGLGRRYGKSRS